MTLSQADVLRIRDDFPILSRKVHGKSLVYFDNAATSQKPNTVIDMQAKVYRELNANVHRGVHFLSQESTDAYEKSRKKIANFLGVKSEQEIIFTRGTTEAINLVAMTWGRENIQSGDTVIVSRLEHHSNFVPWQSLCLAKKANFKIIEINSDFSLDLEQLENEFKTGKVKLLAITAMSNVLGLITPIKEISKIAKQYNVTILVDGAQALAHLPVKTAAFGDIDFLAFSAHKMCGPTGIGVLWGKKNILDKMPPYQYGGDMILQVGDECSTWNELPWKFEAGTPNYGDSIAFGAALDYLETIGRDNIHQYEMELVSYAKNKLECMDGVKVIVPKDSKNHGGVLSFTAAQAHPHDVATFLDSKGIAIRAGHHCAQPLMRKLGVVATNRASFYFYNTFAEVDYFVDSLNETLRYFS